VVVVVVVRVSDQHIIRDYGDESFQSITCTGTDKVVVVAVAVVVCCCCCCF